MRKKLFRSGQKYKVKSDFISGTSQFFSGEILTFDNETYSPYDGSFAYEFHDEQNSKKTWWLNEDEPQENWKIYFKHVGIFG